MMAPILRVDDLSVSMTSKTGELVPVLENLSFTVDKGRTTALVGESGCGKSMTALAIMRLLPDGFVITGGRVLLDDEDVLAARPRRLRQLRGNAMSMVFQEPMTALNPLYMVGDQIAEVLRYHRGLGRADANQQADRPTQRDCRVPPPSRSAPRPIIRISSPAACASGWRWRRPSSTIRRCC